MSTAEHMFVDAPFTPSGPQSSGLARPADGPLDAGGGVNRAPIEVALRPFTDYVVERQGFPVRSEYVDTFWLPVLGPSSISLLRLVSYEFAAGGDAYVVESEVLGKRLGLGGVGRRSPLFRTLDRLVKFSAGVKEGPSSWRLRTHLGTLPRRHLARLPLELQEAHGAVVQLSP